MSAKQKTFFYTLFKNIPYTDEEWDREQQRRQWITDHPTATPAYKARCKPLKNRPVHRWQYGPTAYSHEEAKKVCEKAMARGAQQAEYVTPDEKWVCGTDLVWKQFIRDGYVFRRV